MNKRKLFLFGMDAVLILLLIWFDQFTKDLAVNKLMGKPAYVIWEGVFELDYLENRGVAFGMLQNKIPFILTVGVLFLICIFWLLGRMPDTKKFNILHIIFSFIIAGGIGNMIDRVANGYVIDFFSFVLIDFAIFNVADVYVVCATILLAIMILFVFKDDELTFLEFKRKPKQEN